MLILSLALALAADQAAIAASNGAKDQPGSAGEASGGDEKSTVPASAPVPCVDRAGNIIGTAYMYRPSSSINFLTCRSGALPANALSPRPPVPAKIFQGPYDLSRNDILGTLAARPLDQIGEDVIRFSSTPSLTGGGWVVELRREGREASGTRRTLPSGTPRRIEQAVTVPITMSRAEYDALAAQFDVLMARNEPDMREDNFSVTGCLDGTSLVAERRIGGLNTWRKGSCDGPREEHPNSAIARLMARLGT